MLRYFVPVGCFLVFNICDLLGRLLAQVTAWPAPSWSGSLVTLALSLARLAFIPLLLFCNIRWSEEIKYRLYKIMCTIAQTTDTLVKCISNQTLHSSSSMFFSQ